MMMKKSEMKHMAVPLDAHEVIKAYAAERGLTHPEAIRQLVLKKKKPKN
jgi:hypothetical protein